LEFSKNVSTTLKALPTKVPILFRISKRISNTFKGTIAPVCVWLKVVWLEREKLGDELLIASKISAAPSFLIKLNTNSTLQMKGMQIAMFFMIAAVQFCPRLLLANGFISRIFHCPQPIGTFAQQA
jgi:hypothetical protein